MVPLSDDERESGDADTDAGAAVDADADAGADSQADAGTGSEADAGADPDADAGADADESEQPADPPSESTDDRDSPGGASGFLGNIKDARKQLGDAKDAFSNARGAGTLPTDEDGKVRIVCRRYDERRLAPLDDLGRPTCYEAGNEDCESCVDAVSDGSVETW